MSPIARLVLKGVQYFTSPLSPDDYLALINPLWSTTEYKGRVDRIRHESPDATTLFITPGFRWTGHQPGQYLRVGFDIEGKRHWRAYSLSSDDARADGKITVTVKRKQDGVVSEWVNSSHALGALVTLGEVEGEFVLPATPPARMLFLTAGSGVTPVMAMLQSLDRAGDLPDIVHLHSARTPGEAIFREALFGLTDRHLNYRLMLRSTSTDGRVLPEHLDDLCPDWRERQTYACGPAAMLDELTAHFAAAGLEHQLHLESFEHFVLGVEGGEGGLVTLAKSKVEAACDGATPILTAGEAAGAVMPFGCRMGICHTCTGLLSSGEVRDLRTGYVTRAGTEIRTCVNSPQGPVTVEL